MADAAYDAVVIGGGHHGTIISCYLAKAGLDVAVLEGHTGLGGGAVSEEAPAPGFRQNPHAHFTRFYGHPAYADFNLRDEGLEYVFPEQNEGMIFEDGSSFIGYSAFRVVDPTTGRTEEAPDNVRKTYDQIKAFSQRDADVYLTLFDQYKKYWKPAFHKHRFSAPTPWGTPDALEALCDIPDSGIEPVHQYMSVRQIAYDFFESPELRTLFMRATPTSGGCFPDDPMGLQSLVHVMGLVLSFEPAAIVKGGTQSITDALVKAGKKLGVRHFTGHEVDRIIVENGAAVGVRLAGGGTIKAPLVVSALGAPQTFLRLLRGHPLSEKLIHRIKNIHYDRGQIFWGNVAMHELPRYTADHINPGVGSQPRLYTGAKDPEYLASRYQHDIFLLGFPQQPYILTAPDSIWDRTRAPEGKHTILIEDFTAPARLFSARDWGRIKEEFTERALEEWQKYAPNMTKDNIIGVRIYGPYDVQAGKPDMIEGGWTEGSMFASQLGRYRPIPELSGFRTPIRNMYMCSSNLHSAGGIGRGSSYIAYKIIAQDHGLPQFWERSGREY
ncbi:MAG: NAD(P)/FAD-dependent oxidoreductase [Rhodospirillales bacterium]|nr:NAD(P)/FAD-dependent oxidoreductase [Rhodospirillales bacterium]